MEWVETTGKTVAEALEAALEQLGVAEHDAEVVVIEEPRMAMFGLRRSGARIRARVRPVEARAKRPSRRSSTSNSSDARAGRRSSRTSQPAARQGVLLQPGKTGGSPQPRSPRAKPGNLTPRSRAGRAENSQSALADAHDQGQEAVASKEEQMSSEAQAEMAADFVRGVVRAFGVSASVESSMDDDVIQVRVVGEGLGLLVGPRGATVDAIQELTRTAVQHRSDEQAARIHVDVAGYRARRAAALKEFARRVADEVRESGQPQALEPMNAVDRKAVHDAVSEIGGVATTSEGEDPRRYVVVRPVAEQAVDDDTDTENL